MDKKIKYLRIILVLGIIVVVIIYMPILRSLSLSDILNFTSKSPVTAVLIFLGLYCLKSVTMAIPLVILYISAGIVFPMGWAILLTYLCLTAEMTIAFYLGRSLGHYNIIELLKKNEHAKRILMIGSEHSLLGCFFVRLLPAPPADLTSMFLGTTKVKYARYITGSLLGLTPGMIPVVLMGEAITDPYSEKFLIPLFVKVIVLAVTIFVYKRTQKTGIEKHRYTEGM